MQKLFHPPAEMDMEMEMNMNDPLHFLLDQDKFEGRKSIELKHLNLSHCFEYCLSPSQCSVWLLNMLTHLQPLQMCMHIG